MTVKRYLNIIEVDIHYMYCNEAKIELENLLNNVSDDVSEVIVIHGYHDGKVLLNMVRKKLKHKKIVKKVLSLNNGQTTLLLK